MTSESDSRCFSAISAPMACVYASARSRSRVVSSNSVSVPQPPAMLERGDHSLVGGPDRQLARQERIEKCVAKLGEGAVLSRVRFEPGEHRLDNRIERSGCRRGRDNDRETRHYLP